MGKGARVDPDIIELRTRRRMLGVLYNWGGTALLLETKLGDRLFTVDLTASALQGEAVIFERVLHPGGADLEPPAGATAGTV